MEHIVLIILVLAFIFISAYTINFQRAIMETAKRLSNDNGDVPENLQDILTPKSQIARNVSMYILMFILFVFGSMIYTWYLAIAILLVSLCILSPLASILLPKPDHPYYQDIIKREVEKRLIIYKSEGYASTTRSSYVENILTRLS